MWNHATGLDGEHFWAAMIYVERNPVRAAMTALAWEYAWSSAAAHCGLGDDSGLIDLPAWRKLNTGGDWRDSLRRAQDDKLADTLRLCTSRGRPLGSDSFIAKLESTLGRRLRALPEGRPSRRAGDPGAQ